MEHYMKDTTVQFYDYVKQTKEENIYYQLIKYSMV